MPDISIISPCLNSAEVIADCLRSVSEQGVDLQHLIIDGYSTDGSLELVQRSGLPVQVLQQQPTGIYAAINAGISASTGDVVGILHADNFYPSANVLRLVSGVFKDSTVDACYGDLCYVDSKNPARIIRYWKAGVYRTGSFLNGWMPPHPTLFVRRKLHEKLGGYRTDLGTAADYELLVRFLVKHEIRVAYLSEILVHMRSGGSSNVSLQARMKANRMDRHAWEVNGLRPYPWTTVVKPLRKVGQWFHRPPERTTN